MPPNSNETQTDDRAFFDVLFSEHASVVHSFLVGRLSDRSVADDVLSDVFLRAWTNVSTVRAIAPERRRFWLVAVARTCAIDFRRACRRHDTLTERAARVDDSSGDSDPAEVAERRFDAVAIDDAIASLPESLRTVLSLSALGGLDSSDIGALLQIPASTARYRLARARARLKQILSEETPS